jgi:putative ABC transport system permease protein
VPPLSGFNEQNVLTARFALSPKVLDNPPLIGSACRDVVDRARRLPDVEFAALADIIPMREEENVVPHRTTANALRPNQEPLALGSSVSPDYLNVMGIPLLEGRFFNEHDREDSEPVVVIERESRSTCFR